MQDKILCVSCGQKCVGGSYQISVKKNSYLVIRTPVQWLINCLHFNPLLHVGYCCVRTAKINLDFKIRKNNQKIFLYGPSL